jgi:hypothetical protein
MLIPQTESTGSIQSYFGGNSFNCGNIKNMSQVVSNFVAIRACKK